MKRSSHFIFLSYIIFFLSIFTQKVYGKELNFASYEMEPYVGASLEQEGAIAEIIASAFAQSNNKIKISYFPAARAKSIKNSNKYLGVFPVIENTVSIEDYVLSDPLPGIQLGLLKKKSNTPFKSYDSKHIGVLRGTTFKVVKSEFKNAIMVEINSLEQLLKMLDVGRLDYVLIDKHTASDLIVKTLPYLIGQLDFVPANSDYLSVHLAFYKHKASETEKILAAFNQGLKHISATGLVNKILYKHGLLAFESQHDKNTIRIATVNNKELLMMKELSHQYLAHHPDIKLEWRVLDESVLRLRLMSDLAVSGGEFDIITIGAYEAMLWAEKGWLHPIKDLKHDYEVSDIISSIKDDLSYKNTLYALPFYAESSMTYYRKDLFEAAKINMPSQPTWSQIYAMAKKLNNKNKGINGICLRGKPAWGENIALIATIVNGYGGKWFNQGWQPQLTSKEWQAGVSLYIDLMQKYGPINANTLGYQENLELFSQGKCAIWVDATVAAGTLFNPKNSTVHDKTGFAAAPYEVTAEGASWQWTWALAIPASSSSYDNAQNFIEWATSKKYINEVAKQSNWISIPPGTRYSTYKNPHYKNSAPFSDFVFHEIVRASTVNSSSKNSPYQGIQFVNIPEFPAIGNYLGLQICKVLLKKKNLIEALIESQEFAEMQLKLSNKRSETSG